MLHLPDSCPVLHVRDDIEVCSWHLHEHAWSFYISHPCNLSSLVFPFCSYYDTKAVFLAMGITALVCVAVTVFCFQTKVREWNGCSVCSLSEDVCCQWKRTSLSRVAVRHSLNIHGICDQQQMQRFCCVNGRRSCFRASLNLNLFPTQVDFTSCGGFLCIAAVVLMVIGVVTAIVLSFQYVRTCWPDFILPTCFSVGGGCICVTG